MSALTFGPLQDGSIAALSGSSQQLLGVANVQVPNSRNFFLIFNPGNANIGVNLMGGTALIGAAGTVTLAPNGSLAFDSQFVPSNGITVIGTAGQPVTFHFA